MQVKYYTYLNSELEKRWTGYWNKCMHAHPRQHVHFSTIQKEMGKQPVYVIGEDIGEICCVGMFQITQSALGLRYASEAVCQRGPAFDDVSKAKEYLKEVTEYFKSMNVGIIKVAPNWYYPDADVVERMLHEINYTPEVGNKRTATGLIDLNKDQDTLFASFSQSTRREIRRAERAGVRIVPVEDKKEADIFYRYLDEMHKERGLYLVSYKEFQSTFENVLRKKELGVLLSAYHDQTFLGGLWLVRSVKTCHAARYVVVNEALKELSNLSIGPVLWWEGMIWSKIMGCEMFDVEGSIEDVDKSHESYAVHKFKRRFDPIHAERINNHFYVSNDLVYNLLKVRVIIEKAIRHIRGKKYELKRKYAWNK